MKRAEDWIEEWKQLKKELDEEGCALTLNIPSIEQTTLWMNEPKIPLGGETRPQDD